jgi:hypothetical protein
MANDYGNLGLHIPPDLVVKYKALIMLKLISSRSGDGPSSKQHVDTGYGGVSCSHHRRPIGLPLNPMECGEVYQIGQSFRQNHRILLLRSEEWLVALCEVSSQQTLEK